MKNNVRKFVAVFMVLALTLAMAACSSEPSKYAGKWVPTVGKAAGIEIEIATLGTGLETMSIEIEDQGSAKLTMNGETATVDMTESETGIVLSDNSNKMEFTANGDKLEYSPAGSPAVIVFEKK